MSSTFDEFRRGWRVLLASSVGNGSGLSGIAFYSFGVFVVPLVNAFGWTRGQVSIAASFLIIGTAITAPIIGTIIDKLGARKVGLWSMFCLALGYIALTQLNGNIAMFYVAWLLLSLIGGGTTPVVWTRAVNMWFDRGRGLALGLALAGSGVAGVFAPVLCTLLIGALGWQAGYLGIAAFIIFVSMPILFLLFNDHAPAHVHDAATDLKPAVVPGFVFEDSIRQVAFWKIAGGFLFVSAVIAALIINLVPLLIDRGMAAVTAAQIAGVMGIAVLVGRIVVGLLLDRFHAPLVAGILLVFSAVGCLLLTIEGAPAWVAIISVVSLGLAAAAEVDLVAFLTSRFFGMKSYGKIYGLQLTVFYIGAAIGPVCAGLAYDHFQSYLPTLYFAFAALFFGAVVIGTLGRPPEFAKE